EAVHYTRHRCAFGRALVDHGAMTGVLADLALEYEAAVAAALRLSRAVEEAAAGNAEAAAFRRIAGPALKYWICKRAPGHAAEGQARAFVGLAARTLCASLLVRFAPPAVSDAFCAARLGPRFSGAYGDLPAGVDAAAIVERALPESLP